jgi:hypothetical protein
MLFKVLCLDIKKLLLNRRIQIMLLLIPIVSVATLFALRYQIDFFPTEEMAYLPEIVLIKRVYLTTLITIMLVTVFMAIESIQIERRQNNWFLWLRFDLNLADIYSIKVLSNWVLILISVLLTQVIFSINYLALYLIDPLPASQVEILSQVGFFSSLLVRAIPYLFSVTIFHCIWCFSLQSNVIQLIILMIFPLLSLFSFLKYLPNGLLTYHLISQQAIATPSNYLGVDILVLLLISIPLFVLGKKITHYSILNSF